MWVAAESNTIFFLSVAKRLAQSTKYFYKLFIKSANKLLFYSWIRRFKAEFFEQVNICLKSKTSSYMFKYSI